VQSVHGVLSGALKWAHRLDQVARVVTQLVTPPKATRAQMELPAAEDIVRMLTKDRSDGHPFFLAFHLLAYSGARRGEILGLSFRHIDFDGGAVSITRSLVRTHDKGLIFAPTKTERSRRRISLDAATIGLLRDHQARQAEHRLGLGSAYDGSDDLVFADAVGRPLNPQGVTLAF